MHTETHKIHSHTYTNTLDTHLVEKILHQGGYSYVIEVPVHKQQFGKEPKPCDCIVTVSDCLSALFSHNTCGDSESQLIMCCSSSQNKRLHEILETLESISLHWLNGFFKDN